MRILGGHRRSRQAALPEAALCTVCFLLLSSLVGKAAAAQTNAVKTSAAQTSAAQTSAAQTPAAQTTAAQTTAASPSPPPYTPESEVILILDLDGDTISDSFVALEKSGRIFLPVCAVAEAVSLAVNCTEERAYGFIMEESRPIAIDLKDGYAILGRKAFKTKGVAFMRGSEMFVDIDALGKWLPIDFQYREDTSTVKMLPREMLPAQGFKKRQKFKNPPPPVVQKHYDDFTPNRAAASIPTLDVTSQLLVTGGGRIGDKTSTLNSLGLSGDLLYMSSEAHLFTDNDTLKRFDLALFRRSETGFHLGPVPVTQLVLGTSQAPTLDGIGASTTPMYGLFLTNRPLAGASKFLSHDINGYLPAGWDAELFHNGSPIGYQPPSQDGMYHFQNLRVQYGINVFKVIMHGPFGETRESLQTFFSDAITPSGEFLYTLSGAWQTGLTPDEAGSGGRASNLTLTSDFGVSKDLTGSALLVRQADSSGAEHDYLGLGIRTALGYTLISLDLIQSFAPGSGVGGELLTARSSSRDVFGGALQLEQRFFRDFYSVRFPKVADSLLSQTLLKSSYPLEWNEIRFPLYVELGLDARRSGETDWASVWRVTGGWNGWNGALEADVAYLQKALIASSMFQVSTRVKGVSVRGQLGLSLAPRLTASAINVNTDTDLGRGFQLNSGLMHDPVGNTTELRIGLSKRFGLVGYGISATGSTTGVYSVNLAVSASFAADRFNRQAVIAAEALSPSGMIAVSAATGSSGDLPGKEVPGIAFQVNGQRAALIRGSKNLPVIAFLPPDLPAEVTVDLATVEDPFMVPKEEGCHITPRAGVVSACSFTMITGGEIDGMVLVKLGRGDEIPLKEVRLDLLAAGASGKILASTQSQESGYYVFKGVKPGDYRIVIPAEETARLKTSAAAPMTATMPEGGDQISGKDFILERAAAAKQGAPGTKAP